MRRIPRDQVVYSLDKAHPPVLEIDSGDVVCLETYDARTGAVRSDADLLERPHVSVRAFEVRGRRIAKPREIRHQHRHRAQFRQRRRFGVESVEHRGRNERAQQLLVGAGFLLRGSHERG